MPERLPKMKKQRIGMTVALVVFALCNPQSVQAGEHGEQRIANNAAQSGRAQQPEADGKAKSPDVAIINTPGEHTLFGDQRGSVIVHVYEAPPCLLYKVSMRDEKGVLAKGPWPLGPTRKVDGWFMYGKAPDLWVFDGEDTVQLIQLMNVEGSRGFSTKTAKEFPEIMNAAPKPFLDRLPTELKK
jgi:hypothetical protein